MSVTVRHIGEAGHGLVALKDIKVGELIVRDTAGTAIPGNETGEGIVRQLKRIRSAQKELIRKDGFHELYDESMEDASRDSKIHFKVPRIAKFCDEISIFFNNDIETDDCFRCLLLYLSLLNHSCDPNSFWTGTVNNPRQLELRAAKDIEEGEEMTVNYILVEGRFSDRPTRQVRLMEGWRFYCKCSLCQGENLNIHQQKQEILKQEINILQSDMISECDQNPATVSWARLCTLQSELVELVGQLSCGQLLLGRELKSLANLAQLARRDDILDNTLNSWDLIIQELGVERWRREYNFLVEKLRKWTLKRKKKDNPNDEEIRQFLWLM
eukprot:GFUD01083701.1.p1 GENE.GFUD01083701.1~~GFUD01083701.1.p1  ORF type:complete len:327 (-),score=99.46 GFUD01083701.1:9-989(-)